jgi:peptidoglycan/xylan/chitin deacetylase (PgdA/CDA1 family)
MMVAPTVCLSFDFDGFAPYLAAPGGPSATALSRAEFGGRVGMRRILDLLAREELPATFFVPGHTIECFQDACRAAVHDGHELAHHGYLHLDPCSLDEAEARDELERGIEVIERIVGVLPKGYRAPGGNLSRQTLELLVEYGFAYESSLMAQDFEPYYVRIGDRIAADTPFTLGEEVDLVELPMLVSLIDAPQMEFLAQPLLPGLHANAKVYATWREEFDWMRERVPGGVLVLVMHPSTIARGARLAVLERLIRHMKESGATFVLMREAAAEWRAGNPLSAARRVF